MKKITLTQGQFALVDDADFDIVSLYKWSAKKDGRTYYATNKYAGTMHRFLLEAHSGQMIDHKDRNGLNNQRENIWHCTRKENTANRIDTIKHKGVWFCKFIKSTNKWRATAWDNGLIHIGMFPSEIEASNAINNYNLTVSR